MEFSKSEVICLCYDFQEVPLLTEHLEAPKLVIRLTLSIRVWIRVFQNWIFLKKTHKIHIQHPHLYYIVLFIFLPNIRYLFDFGYHFKSPSQNKMTTRTIIIQRSGAIINYFFTISDLLTSRITSKVDYSICQDLSH